MYSLGAPARVSGFMRFFFFAVISLVFTFCLTLTAHAATVGATPGSFSVSNSGRATYTIPLTLPPGINGVQPSLALRYRSGSGNGLLGLGWSISGLSVIHRCDQTIAQNGQIHGVDYSTDDRLCLNGNQLRVVSGSYWSSSAVYRTERERFVRITQHGSGVNAWFEVEYKNGRRAEFGHSPDSAINAASGSGIDGIRLWAINRLADRNGNAVVYHYTEDTANGGYRPSRIEYTVSHGAAAFYQIHFDYDTDRPDSIEGYLGGSERTQTARLSAIRIETTSNAPVRRYTLAYEIASAVHQSRLLSVTECAGANWSRCLRPTTFDWGAGAKGWEITANDGYESHLLDLNGDGYKDLIYRQSGQWKLRWGGANGFTAERATGLADNTTYYGPSKLIVDHNGDGHQELLLPEADREGDWYLLGYGANGLYRTNTGMPTIINERTKKSVDVVRVVDINGDGRSDLLRAEESAEELAGESGLWVWLGVDTGWEKQPIWDLGFPVYVVKMQDPNAPMHLPSLGTFEWMQTGDINADGLSDFLIPCIIDCPGGEPTAVKILSSVTGYQITPSRYSRGALLVDINADGADGVLYKSDEGDWYIAKSNGQDFMAGQRIATSVGYRAKAVDYNADGLTDVLLTTLDSRSVVIRSPEDPSEPERIETNHFRGKEMYVLLSNGQTLTNVGKLNITLPRAESTTDKVTFKDLDNDGLAELVSSIRGVNTFYWHKPSQANLLVGITNGFGNHYSINYKQLTDPANYTRAGDSQKPAYPQKAYTGARKVVASYTADDGTGGTYTVSYHYSDARVNLLGRGLLGFAKRTVTDSRKPGVIVTETFRQDYPFTGFTLNKTLTAPDGNPISVTIITPEKKILSVAGDPQRVFVYPKKTIDKSYALGNNTLLKTTTTTINGMGDWGNPQSINTTVIGNGKTFTTTKTLDYLINQSTWCIGKPDSTSITRTLPNGDTHTQTTTAIIDPVSCRAKSQTLQAAGSNPAVITAYQFDSWGNVSQTTISAQGVASRITKADYQAYQGRFPATLTNAAGHSTTLTWDIALGLKESVTGPNDLTTGFDYDAFGRLIHTNYPDARAITLTYDWCGVDGCGVDGGAYKISQSQATGAQAVSVYDAFGRVIKTASRGLHGAWTYQYTQYGALGHIAKQSQPYQSGTVYWTQYQYDLLGRAVTVQHPYNPNSGAGGGQTTTDYSGFTTTVTNANGQVSQKFDNAIGQTIKVVDALNNVTRYAYDAAGNLIKTTDPLGNVILMDYDNRGNKIAMDDPDMGHWSYDYNAFGELIKQTDAKGQVTTMDYDQLGRLVKRIEGADTASAVTSRWIYGAVNAIGKLDRVTQSTGFEKVISYDSLSRPVETTVTIDTVDYTTTTVYDAYSRVQKIIYPYSMAAANNPVNAVADSSATRVITDTPVTLDGSRSSDADTYQTLSYHWTQSAGPGTPISNANSARATITPAAPGTYQFTLTVSDGSDSATDSITVDVTPRPVGSLTISDGAVSQDGNYTLNWAAPAGGLPAGSQYRLYVSADPGFNPAQQIASGSSTSHVVSGQANGTWNYRLVVCAADLCSSDVTAQVRVELPPGAPGTPVMDEAPISTDGSYSVSWTAPSTGVYTGYVLHETPGTAQPLDGGITRLSQTGQANDTTYTYRVAACNGSACTSSGSRSIKVIIPPGTPAGISVPTSTADGSETISWGAASGDVDYYQLQEALTAGFGSLTHDWTQTGLSRSISLSGNDTWYYRVRACNSYSNEAICGAWRASATGLRNDEPPSWLASPTFSDGPVSTDGDYSVIWSAPAGQFTAVTHYVLSETPGNGQWTISAGTQSKVFSNRPNGTTWSYTVKACNNQACTSSASHAIKVIIPPGAPASISVPPSTTDGSETISWGAASGDVDYYQLQEASTASFSSLTHNWTQTGLSRSISLSGNDTWYYRVRACNTYSNTTRCGNWRTAAQGLRNDEVPGVMTRPTISDGSISNDGNYSIHWSKPAGLVTGYVLLEEPGIGQWALAPEVLQKTLTGRASDTTYSYHVKACNHAACTASEGSSVKVVLPPGTPASLTVPNSSADGAETISWGAASGNVDYYQLQEAKSTSFGSLTHNWTQSGRSRSVTLNGNDTWYYRVRACNTYSNETQCSNWRTDTTGLRNDEAPGTPAAPSISDGSVSTDGGYTISWSAPSGQVTGYTLYENPGSGQWSVSAGTRSKTLSGRNTDTTYSYQVKACNQTACTTSANRSVTVVIPPGTPPSISVPNSTTDGSEPISWGAASAGNGEVNYYQLQEAKSTSFSSLTHNWMQSGTSRTINVTGNDIWYYRVRACNDFNNITRCGAWRTDTAGLHNYNYEKPGAPTGISASFNTSAGSSMTGQMSVTWGAASSGPVDHYELYRRQRTTVFDTTWSGWSHVTDTASRSHSAMVTNGIYQYRVRACNPVGCSAYTGSSEVGGISGGGYKCPPFCGAEAHHKPAPATAATMPQPMQVASATAYGFHAQPPARPYDLAQLAHKLNRHSRAGGHPSLALSPTFPVGAASYAANARAQKTSDTQNRYANNAYVSTLKASGDGSGYRFTVQYVYGQYGHLTQVRNEHNPSQVYWQATNANAWGHITEVTLGNGITTSRVYDPATGYLTAIDSTLMSTGDIQYQTYSWDPLGNLKSRHWEITQDMNIISHTETFDYDKLNRLTRTVLDNIVTQTIDYNAIGNITSKTGLGTYTYGTGNAGPHALTGVNGHTYQYDANGNMTSGNGRTITWNAANYPVQVTQGAITKTFEYGPAKQRYLQHRYTNGALAQTMITIGGLFQRTENYTSGKITYQHYIRAAGKTIAIHTRQNNYTQKIEYLHRDHLGSIVAITDEDGDIVARMRYDAFGARQQTDGQGTATNPLPAMDRGYTGHQMLDAVGLIHMNGRVYDPGIGRFLSADPFIQFPYSTQSYNRYSYVRNNPLSVTDPSGFVEDRNDVTVCDKKCQEELPEETQEEIRECQQTNGGWGCALVNGEVMPISEVQKHIQHEFQQRQEMLGDPNLIDKYQKVAADAINMIQFVQGLTDEQLANHIPWELRDEDGNLRYEKIRWTRLKLVISLSAIRDKALARLTEHAIVGGIETGLQQLVTRGVGKLLPRGAAAPLGAILRIKWGIPKEDYGGDWHPVFLLTPDGVDVYYDTINWREMTELY